MCQGAHARDLSVCSPGGKAVWSGGEGAVHFFVVRRVMIVFAFSSVRVRACSCARARAYEEEREREDRKRWGCEQRGWMGWLRWSVAEDVVPLAL